MTAADENEYGSAPWSTGPKDGAHSFHRLNEFARGWVEAAASSILGIRPGDTGLSAYDLGPDALTPEAVEALAAYCSSFERKAAQLLSLGYERTGPNGERYGAYDAGGDLCWSTIEGEGYGFSDRDELRADDLGSKLQAAAREHGTGSIYSGHDDRVHFDHEFRLDEAAQSQRAQQLARLEREIHLLRRHVAELTIVLILLVGALLSSLALAGAERVMMAAAIAVGVLISAPVFASDLLKSKRRLKDREKTARSAGLIGYG